MKREIKFRVWDNEEKKLFTPIYEAYKGKLLDLSIGLGGDILRRTLEFSAEHQSMFPNKYELGQFTGLKDKNGVDIYEGDILSGYPHGNSIVSWDDEYGCWHSGSDLIGNEIKDMPERIIIGNIHENPELL